MKTEHLSDEEIQQYAFDPSECKLEVTAHMSSCSLCQERAENYLALSNSMMDLPSPRLAFDLSDRVVTQLESRPVKKPIVNYLIYSLITIGVVMVLSFAYYSFETLMDLFNGNSAISTFLIVSVAIIMAFGMVVDMLRSYYKKLNLLNS